MTTHTRPVDFRSSFDASGDTRTTSAASEPLSSGIPIYARRPAGRRNGYVWIALSAAVLAVAAGGVILSANQRTAPTIASAGPAPQPAVVRPGNPDTAADAAEMGAPSAKAAEAKPQTLPASSNDAQATPAPRATRPVRTAHATTRIRPATPSGAAPMAAVVSPNRNDITPGASAYPSTPVAPPMTATPETTPAPAAPNSSPPDSPTTQP